MNYPYVCTRIRARKGALFVKEDYRRFASMNSIKEFLEALAKTRYARFIKEARPLLGELELLHHATLIYFGRESMEIYRMLDESLREKLYPLFARTDMHNILITIRAKYTGLPKRDLEFALIPAPKATPELMLALYDMDIGGIIAALSSSPLVGTAPSEGKLRDIEDVIFLNWVALLKTIKEPTIQKYTDFLADVYSALGVLRTKLANREDLQVLDGIPSEEWRNMRDATVEEVLMKIHERFGISRGSYMDMETELEGQVLRRGIRLMRLNPVSAAPIVGYLSAIEAETRNLRLIGYGIKAGMTKGEIWRELIYESRRGG